MTAPGNGHDRFAELAAGYALHALAPEDEQALRLHLPGCPQCRQALREYREVAVALAESTPAGAPNPLLGQRIVAAARSAPPPATGRQDGLRGRGRGWRRTPVRRRLDRRLVAAAAGVLLAAGAVAGGLVATGGGGAASPLAGCTPAAGCNQVALVSASSHRSAAKVVVRSRTVWLLPAGLPADNPAADIYVLWQVTGSRTPLPVGSFDVRRGGDTLIRLGALPAPYGDTWVFAVSLERGRTIPAVPSRPVALGVVSG